MVNENNHPTFALACGAEVIHTDTSLKGRVLGRAEFEHEMDYYLVRSGETEPEWIPEFQLAAAQSPPPTARHKRRRVTTGAAFI